MSKLDDLGGIKAFLGDVAVYDPWPALHDQHRRDGTANETCRKCREEALIERVEELERESGSWMKTCDEWEKLSKTQEGIMLSQQAQLKPLRELEKIVKRYQSECENPVPDATMKILLRREMFAKARECLNLE